MIGWLSNWLENIIVIVLLASFTNLLLPSSSMQKYAKMVLGLLVILTIISPILEIFSEFAVTELINNLDSYSLEEDSVYALAQEGNNELKAEQEYEQKMIKQIEESMKTHLQTFLEDKFLISIDEVLLDAEVVNGFWQINQVYLSVESKENSYKNADSVKEIKSIETISINLNNSAQYKTEIKNSDQELTKQLISEISNEWGLPEEKIIVNLQTDKQ